MKNIHFIFTRFFLGILVFCLPTLLFADPPTHVIRLSEIDGTVTFAPAGVDQWVYATRNRPLTTGDRLWSDTGSRARLQLGAAAICLGDSTSINVLNLDDKSVQIELDQGVINLRIWKTSGNQSFEIDTPNLALTVDQPGEYKINVDPTNSTTSITVRNGQAAAYGKGNSYQINNDESYAFSGTDLKNYESIALTEPDSLDKWCALHKQQGAATISSQYVASNVIGQDDLDSYGNWQPDPVHKHVWYPSHVSSDWAPYSQGQWTWIDPWGWTWVDEAPWGFAPFHYGRWVYLNQGWGWVPGPVVEEAIYAPALVAFFADIAISLAGGGIGWFPLGPGDVYIPPFAYSHNYFNRINRSNAFLNPAVVMHAFENPKQTFKYSNLHVPHAITAVSKVSFVHSLPVAKAAISVPKIAIEHSHPTGFAPLAPVKASVTGSSTTVNFKPSAKVLAEPIIAKTTPPAPPVSFAAKQAILAKNPGKPLAPAALLNLRPGVTNAAHQVTVVKPSQPLIIPRGMKPATKALIRPTGPNSPRIVPHPPTPATPMVIEHHAGQPVPTGVIPHGEPKFVPNPARISPHVEPKFVPNPARIAPHVEPKFVPKPARIAPHAEPKFVPNPVRIAPHVEPKVEQHPARIAPHVEPKVEPQHMPRGKGLGRDRKEDHF